MSYSVHDLSEIALKIIPELPTPGSRLPLPLGWAPTSVIAQVAALPGEQGPATPDPLQAFSFIDNVCVVCFQYYLLFFTSS